MKHNCIGKYLTTFNIDGDPRLSVKLPACTSPRYCSLLPEFPVNTQLYKWVMCKI